jgi:hypothetical protein
MQFSRLKSRSRLVLWLVGLLLATSIMVTFSSPAQVSQAQPPSIQNCPIFPADNIWNTPINNLPVAANSAAYISTLGTNTGLHPDFGSGIWDGAPIGIPYTTVPQGQTKVPMSFGYASESDPGPYPIPTNAPIEGGPSSNGDRHVLVMERGTCKLYETWSSYPQNGGTSWTAGSGAVFDLTSNVLRHDGWTSADAAGLPILPGLARYDEVAAGAINHALRFTVANSQNSYVWPARHPASSSNNPAYPPMGQRFRLKASYVIPSNFSPQTKVILQALKTYGMIVADNGSNWYISGAPDAGWNDDALVSELSQVKGLNFEAVDSSSLMINASSGQAAVPPTAAPSNLTATTASASQINLTWTDNSPNESGFYIARKTGPGGSYSVIATVGSGVTSYNNSGLTDGTAYYYQVQAFNSYGTTVYSNQASATTTFKAPSSLTAAAISSSQINLTWTDNSSSETGYYIERKMGASGSYSQIAITAANATSFSDTGLMDNTTYYYQIRAFNAYGLSAYSSPANATTFLAPPVAPSKLSAWAISATQVKLLWNDSSHNEDGFVIDRSPNGSTGWTQLGAMTGPNVTTGSDTTVTANNPYYYRIKAHNAAGYSAYTYSPKVDTTIWPVSVSPDNGLGTIQDTLSYALANGHATAGQTVLFNISNITFSSGATWNPVIPNGVNLVGNCDNNGPTVTIDGSGVTGGSAGMVLNHNILVGLKITKFPNVPQIKANGNDNLLICVVAQH